MSTRSMIGQRNEDGAIRCIYCHFDGYPSHVGDVLINHYTDPEKISSLLDLGDISCLAENIGEKHEFDACPKCVVNAYGRDCGEDNIDAKTVFSVAAFIERAHDAGTDYQYLHMDGAWHIRDGSNFVPLTQDMCNDD